MQEANVCEVEICADPLEYACVRAQPNYQVSPPPICTSAYIWLQE